MLVICFLTFPGYIQKFFIWKFEFHIPTQGKYTQKLQLVLWQFILKIYTTLGYIVSLINWFVSNYQLDIEKNSQGKLFKCYSSI